MRYNCIITLHREQAKVALGSRQCSTPLRIMGAIHNKHWHRFQGQGLLLEPGLAIRHRFLLLGTGCLFLALVPCWPRSWCLSGPRPRAPTIKLINHAILHPHWLMLWCIVGVTDLSPNNTASDALLVVFIVAFRLL
jgi:hypothetical protein